MKVIIDSFSASDNIKDIQTNGFHVGGEKFFTLRADDSRVYGKLVRFHFLRCILFQLRIPYTYNVLGENRHRHCQD